MWGRVCVCVCVFVWDQRGVDKRYGVIDCDVPWGRQSPGRQNQTNVREWNAGREPDENREASQLNCVRACVCVYSCMHVCVGQIGAIWQLLRCAGLN